MVARQTLTLFVWVQILVGQPKEKPAKSLLLKDLAGFFYPLSGMYHFCFWAFFSVLIRPKTRPLFQATTKELQETLLSNPKAGDVVKGTGGLRKFRIAFHGRGKSGSGRVAYVDFTTYDCIYLITAYPKNEKDNLSPKER